MSCPKSHLNPNPGGRLSCTPRKAWALCVSSHESEWCMQVLYMVLTRFRAYICRCRTKNCHESVVKHTRLRGILEDLYAQREPCCVDFLLEILTTISGFLREMVNAQKHRFGSIDKWLLCRARHTRWYSALSLERWAIASAYAIASANVEHVMILG